MTMSRMLIEQQQHVVKVIYQVMYEPRSYMLFCSVQFCMLESSVNHDYCTENCTASSFHSFFKHKVPNNTWEGVLKWHYTRDSSSELMYWLLLNLSVTPAVHLILESNKLGGQQRNQAKGEKEFNRSRSAGQERNKKTGKVGDVTEMIYSH